eukprot:7436356-Pyramimonas_sp.AAC.1
MAGDYCSRAFRDRTRARSRYAKWFAELTKQARPADIDVELRRHIDDHADTVRWLRDRAQPAVARISATTSTATGHSS